MRTELVAALEIIMVYPKVAALGIADINPEGDVDGQMVQAALAVIKGGIAGVADGPSYAGLAAGAELNLANNIILAQFGAEGSVAIRNSGGAPEPAATVWPISTLRETTVPSTGATISVWPRSVSAA